MKTKKIIALCAVMFGAAGLYFVFNKKPKGAKSDAAPKCETPAASAPDDEAEREEPNRRLRAHIITRVEINQPNSQKCNNFVSQPDGIIVVTDKGVTGAFEAVPQPEQGKRRPAKDGRKHRGGRGKKKNANGYMPDYKQIHHLRHTALTPELELELRNAKEAAKAFYNPQESRKSRNNRRGAKRA